MSHKIIDCFLFYNELDMLKFRLEYLYNTVDKFILVEATLTHAGNKKELYYNNNKHLFEKYNDKIIHIIANDLPSKELEANAWIRENIHRQNIEKGFNEIDLNDNDIICLCDLDEIPDKNILNNIKNLEKIENNLYALEQDFYYYNLNCKYDNKWYHAKLFNFYTYKNILNKNLNNIRSTFGFDSYNPYTIKNGGWHFSYFGDVNFIKNKIAEFAHQELNNDTYKNEETIINNIKNNIDLYNREGLNYKYIDIKDNNYLPENYEKLLKFSNLYK
jgi:beta-1,4-mannosyl-glycoprotein beta-1,4-N-acetylglucosaminyltransferase